VVMNPGVIVTGRSWSIARLSERKYMA
jgi:hypothetical protein